MNSFGPYIPLVVAGNMFFVSGQIGIDPKSGSAAEDISLQTKQTLENFKQLVESNGYSLSDIKKTTLFLTDMGDFAAVNEVYQEFFRAPWPARSCVAVKELPRIGSTTLKIEIEGIGITQ